MNRHKLQIKGGSSCAKLVALFKVAMEARGVTIPEPLSFGSLEFQVDYLVNLDGSKVSGVFKLSRVDSSERPAFMRAMMDFGFGYYEKLQSVSAAKIEQLSVFLFKSIMDYIYRKK